MIVLGGSSMHKGANGWQAGRAIACLPALTGNVGVAGGGFGPRHGSAAHGRGLGSIIEPERRRRAPDVPNQMSAVAGALREGRIRTLLLMGTNMLSSYADAGDLEEGLQRTPLIVSHDLFLNDTARRFADIVLPSTAWLEEVGCKMTHTHLYLMERALAPPGETRSLYAVINELAERLCLAGFHPWPSEEAMVNAILDHPCTGRATVAALQAESRHRIGAEHHTVHRRPLDQRIDQGRILDHVRERLARRDLTAERQIGRPHRVLQLGVGDDHVEDRLRAIRDLAPDAQRFEQPARRRRDRRRARVAGVTFAQRRVGHRDLEAIAEPLAQRDGERQAGEAAAADQHIGAFVRSGYGPPGPSLGVDHCGSIPL
jgi:hypothetical protein